MFEFLFICVFSYLVSFVFAYFLYFERMTRRKRRGMVGGDGWGSVDSFCICVFIEHDKIHLEDVFGGCIFVFCVFLYLITRRKKERNGWRRWPG